jgi:uncharacterized repeat protein (TIGR01451 family)
VRLGTYRIIEQPPVSIGDSTWILTSVQCDGVDMPFSQGAFLVTLNRSHPHANCRFTNTLTHRQPGDPEPTEPGAPMPGASGSQAGNVWANVSVASTPKRALVMSGQRITDTVVVTNHGPSDAEGVMLNYQVPKGTKLVSVHTKKGKCSGKLALTCKLGTLKSHQKVTLTVVMLPRQVSGVFKMHAAVGSVTYDPRLANNARNELVHIEVPPPRPPSPPVGCPSRATPIAHAAC